MPKNENGVPRYRRHRDRTRGTDRAFVEFSGRRVYLGPYNSPESRAAYARELAEWESGGKRAPTAKDALTILELVDRFWTHAEGYYRKPDGTPTSELGLFRIALRPLKELYGMTSAAEFGPLSLQVVRDKFIAKGMVRNSINHMLNRLKAVFKWAVSQELLPPAAHQAIVTVAGLRRGRSEARETESVRAIHLGCSRRFPQNIS
jgi:hypothetical protein